MAHSIEKLKAAAKAAALSMGCLLFGGGSHLTAIVSHAVFADAVGQGDSTTLGTGVDTGGLQLPHGTAALISALLGYFTLGYCHI